METESGTRSISITTSLPQDPIEIEKTFAKVIRYVITYLIHYSRDEHLLCSEALLWNHCGNHEVVVDIWWSRRIIRLR